MTPPTPPRPPLPPRPPRPPRAQRRGRVVRSRPDRVPSWGWVEWTIAAQVLLPGLIYVPGLSAIRTVLRVASYAVPLAAWFICSRNASSPPGADSFPARPWLWFCVGWLGLSVLHPNSNSPVAAAAQAAFYMAIFVPAFWAPGIVRSKNQVPRMLAVFFVCNALSTVLGIAQFYRPEIFNPPSMPASEDPYFGRFYYEAADGRMVLRPCGLTDSPGGACLSGMVTALLGLCWALRPIAVWKRLVSLGLAFLGVAVIYLTHVRGSLVMLAICLAALAGVLVLQRRLRQAALLAGGGVGVILGALAWAVSTAGSGVLDRFISLFAADPTTVYNQNRGGFVRHAFEEVLWDYPLGYGMGWWGMINAYFGRKDIISPIWVEVMWPAWIYDGGFPLLIGYVGAIAVALFDSLRIALTSKDRALAFWAAVVVASNLAVFATSFSAVSFLSVLGVQFWLQAAVLHGADRLASGRPGLPAA